MGMMKMDVSVQMQAGWWVVGGGEEMGGHSWDCSYAVRSVPRAGFAVLGSVRVWGQAATVMWVVGGHVRGALGWVVVLREGWARGHGVALFERAER